MLFHNILHNILNHHQTMLLVMLIKTRRNMTGVIDNEVTEMDEYGIKDEEDKNNVII